MITSLRSRIRKAAVAVALVGLFAGATATPALAGHNSGEGNKDGHENENGQRKGHAKQDGDANLTPEEICENNGGTFVVFPGYTVCLLGDAS